MTGFPISAVEMRELFVHSVPNRDAKKQRNQIYLNDKIVYTFEIHSCRRVKNIAGSSRYGVCYFDVLIYI